MDQRQIEQVRSSYARLAPRAEAMGIAFYRFLFELNPDARTLFVGDMGAQVHMLKEVVREVVENLDHPDQLLASCRAMGERHSGYGLQESHYDDVGTALLKTLHAGMGEHYTDELEGAWAAVYGEMAETMMAAGQHV